MYDTIVEAWRHQLGAQITVCRLDRNGESEPLGRRVWVSDQLTPAERRSTTMHELAHVALQHRPIGDPRHDAALEDAADEWAAVRLIPVEVWSWAQDIARDDRELAEICGVDPGIIVARRRLEDQGPTPTPGVQQLRSVG